MNQSTLVLRLFSDRPVDAEWLDEASQSLRSDLLDIHGVATVASDNAEPMEGTKSAGLIALNSLLIHIATGMSVPLISRQFTGVIRDWLRRNDGKRVAVKVPGGEFELTGLSAPEATKIIESILAGSAGGELPVGNDSKTPQ